MLGAQSEAVTSSETTPLRASELPAIGAVVLDSPIVPAQPHMPAALRGDSSSGGSSYGDAEAGGAASPGKLGPADYELLRVVGQGAFGKVGCWRMLALLDFGMPCCSLCCSTHSIPVGVAAVLWCESIMSNLQAVRLCMSKCTAQASPIELPLWCGGRCRCSRCARRTRARCTR